jgi:hypothetical protein
MTNQQHADMELQAWQSLRDLLPEDRMDALVALLFLPIPPCDVEFDAIMRRVSEEMAQ